MKEKETQINFKFAKNWKLFLTWFKSTKERGGAILGAPWVEQKKMITKTFELTTPNILDWDKLWADFDNWYQPLIKEKSLVYWSEQQRQIETLMLNQLKALNEQTFFLVYLDTGKPTIDSQMLTYWEALEIKKELEGNGNGEGGSENLDKINIINLNKLIK